jgi:hypothetical protein
MNPLEPGLTLLCKLGSIAVHTDEFLSPHGHVVDHAALHGLLKDREVQLWLKAMRELALLPEKRNN